jgi:N-acetylneuraminic acid mutarotase
VHRKHEFIFRPRDEASSAAIGSTMYVLGGDGEKSVESFNMATRVNKWVSGPPMPAVSARACGVALDGDSIMVMGKKLTS